MAEFIFIVIFVIIGLILLGLLDEIRTGYGNCPYTAEEIFKAGMEYAINLSIKWLNDNIDLEHDYPNSKEELVNDFEQKMI